MTNGVRLQTKLRPRSARETAARACRHPSGVLSGPSFLDHSDFVFSAFGFGQRLNANFAVFVMKWAVPAPTNSLTLPLYSQCSTLSAPFLYAAQSVEHFVARMWLINTQVGNVI